MADKVLAKEIIDAVGGANNVRSLGHCMTRLRFVLKDISKVNDNAVKAIKGVKGISKPVGGGQYQIIIGTGVVDEYFDAIMKEYPLGEADYSDVVEKQDLEKSNKNVLGRIGDGVGSAMGVLSASIGRWLGCIMGSLMITAILSLCTSLGILSTESSTYQFFSIVSGCCIYSMPVLIGFSAGEVLETNKYMGALIGAIMIYPNMMTAVAEGTVSVFGLSIQNFSYTSTIVPVILAVWLLKYVEKFAKKVCPKVISIFGVTLIELVICVPLVFLVVGPIGSIITNAIASLVMFIYNHAGFLAPAIVGAVLPVAVMCGVHLGLFPIAALMLTEVGFDPIIHPALMVYNMGIAGSSLAYGLKAKNVDDKSLGLSAGLSGVLGISEAGLFGVVLSNKRVLITTEIGILISGVITGIVGYKCYVPLSQSLFSIPAAAHGDFNLAACTISLVSGIVASFLVTYFFGGVSEADKIEKIKEECGTLEISNDQVVAPADGMMVDVATVSDPVFAEKTLGESVAFKYEGDKVVLCAPANGTLSVLFPTLHAYAVTMENGIQLLVHCGINTVKANGDGFRSFGKIQGDTVKAGEPIVEVDLKKLGKDYDMSTILILADDNDQKVEFTECGIYKRGQSIMKYC